MRTLCFGVLQQLPISHTLNFFLLEKSSREQPLWKCCRASESFPKFTPKFLMNTVLGEEYVRYTTESREKRTLKRKYFMLFKCVLYYILTAINFIRLFIRAVFHRGLKREWVNENTRIRFGVRRRRIKWEPLKKTRSI